MLVRGFKKRMVVEVKGGRVSEDKKKKKGNRKQTLRKRLRKPISNSKSRSTSPDDHKVVTLAQLLDLPLHHAPARQRAHDGEGEGA